MKTATSPALFLLDVLICGPLMFMENLKKNNEAVKQIKTVERREVRNGRTKQTNKPRKRRLEVHQLLPEKYTIESACRVNKQLQYSIEM
jgi:hypothetical protein